jgi:hypothetical protein
MFFDRRLPQVPLKLSCGLLIPFSHRLIISTESLLVDRKISVTRTTLSLKHHDFLEVATLPKSFYHFKSSFAPSTPMQFARGPGHTIPPPPNGLATADLYGQCPFPSFSRSARGFQPSKPSHLSRCRTRGRAIPESCCSGESDHASEVATIGSNHHAEELRLRPFR